MEAKSIRPGMTEFVIHNGGKRTHSFRMRSESGSGADGRFRVDTEHIPPGGDAVLSVNLPNGIYEVSCDVHDDAGDHEDLGMRNILIVQDNAPLVPEQPAASGPDVAIERFTALADRIGTR